MIRFALAGLLALAFLAGPSADSAPAAGCFSSGGLLARVVSKFQAFRQANIAARQSRVQARYAGTQAAIATVNALCADGSCSPGSALGVQYTTVTKTVNAAGVCTLCGVNCACPDCQCNVLAASGTAATVTAPKVKTYRIETYHEKVCSVDARGNTTCTMVPRTRIVSE